MSPGGASFATVGKDGTVSFYNRTGRELWKRKVEGANDALIARNGQSVLVYSKLNPRYQMVSFFQGGGQLLWRHHVDGSVWCSAVSQDSTRVAVTTGKRYMYVYRPDPRRPRFKRWQLEGIGHSIAFSPDNRRLIIGTWQESQLACYDVDGTFQWKTQHNTENQYNIQASADGATIMGILPGKQSNPKLELGLWNSDGKQLWQRNISGFDGRALVSPTSQYVAASYASALPGDSGMIERKVTVYKNDGSLLWEKGGLFFGPRLVALSPTGSSVICWDGASSLYNINSKGKMLSKLRFGGTIDQIVTSEDGHIILVYCKGWLYSLHVG
jgi:outer membrane protein assembly factor BamB